MINAVRCLTGALILGGMLAGCSYSSQQVDALSTVQRLSAAGKEVLAANRSRSPEKTVLTPEDLAKITMPLIQINPEVFGGSDFLTRAVSRRDSGLGAVEVWNSSDKAQIFLRNGVLVGTRGIGGDIIAADANSTIRALRSGTDARGLRRYTLSDGDVTTTDYSFRCHVINLGMKRISVADQYFDTRHMRENCISITDDALRLSNEYWVQPASGLVQKSRQWVGPSTGYFEIIVIKN